MSTKNYSEMQSSNGTIVFNVAHPSYEKVFDQYFTYLRIYRPRGAYKVYLNDSTDYIRVYQSQATWENGVDELVIEGFQLSKIKIVSENPALVSTTGSQGDYGLQYYVMR